jgi:hypothetical protein
MAMILAGTSLVGPGALAGQEPSPPAVDDPEAYRVYASLLSTKWPVGADKPRVVVIQQETSTWDGCGGFRQSSQDEFRLPDRHTAWKPAFDAYRAAKQTVRALLPGQELGFPHKIMTAREIFLAPASLDSRGHIQLSAVGFDAARTRAIVSMAYQCGGLCGGGSLYLLEKVTGVWREAGKLCEWWS